MKPFAAFLKMQLNVNYGISALKYRFTREKKKLWEPVLIAVVIAASVIPLLALYIGMMISLFAAGVIMGQPEIVLTVSVLMAQIMILFFGLFYVMGTFYFSTDMDSFVPLPLKPYEVIGGKFAVIMVNEYLTSTPILLPPIITYGIGTSQGLLYWIKSLLLILTVPVLPLTAAALLIMLLMRFVNLRKYKDALAIIGGITVLILSVGFSMYMQKIPENAEELQNFFIGQTGFANLLGRRFPPLQWAVGSLTEGGLAGIGYLLLFLCTCAILFMLLMMLANIVFYKALLAGQEVSRRKKVLTDQQKQNRYGKVSGQVSAMMKREWKLLVRTPIYVMNGLVGTIIGPFILVIMLVVQGSEPEFAALFTEIANQEYAPYVLLGGLGLMLFTSGMNLVASTALSREGQTLWITKMIPVTAKQQVNAKLLIGLAVSAIGVLATALVMLIYFKLPVLWVLGASAAGIIGSVPMVVLSFLLDVFHPKLIWNSEQEAMKQNMNGGLGMLLSMLVLMIYGAVAAGLLILKLPVPLVLLGIVLVSAVLGVLSLLALYTVADRKYRELEA